MPPPTLRKKRGEEHRQFSVSLSSRSCSLLLSAYAAERRDGAVEASRVSRATKEGARRDECSIFETTLGANEKLDDEESESSSSSALSLLSLCLSLSLSSSRSKLRKNSTRTEKEKLRIEILTAPLALHSLSSRVARSLGPRATLLRAARGLNLSSRARAVVFLKATSDDNDDKSENDATIVMFKNRSSSLPLPPTATGKAGASHPSHARDWENPAVTERNR